MAELVDAADLKSADRMVVRVRLPLPVPIKERNMIQILFERIENGSSAYTDKALEIGREFHDLVDDFITKTEESGPCDLRDLDTLLRGTVSDVILCEIISRRLE